MADDAGWADPEAVARALLDELRFVVGHRDLDGLAAYVDDEIVVFGTGRAALGRAEALAYLGGLVGEGGIVSWAWDEVFPLVTEPHDLAFAVEGTVGFAGSDERRPFRLTIVAVRHDGRWRIRHLHASVAET